MDINFDSSGGTGSVTYALRCNGTVRFATNATWIKGMRYGSGELTFTVEENFGAEKSGTITPSVNGIECPDKVITVIQRKGSEPEPCDTHTETSVTKSWDVTKDVRIVLDKESVGCDGGKITASLIGGVEYWQEVTSKVINCSGTAISTTTSSAKTGENTETIESSTYTFNLIENDGEDHDIPYTFSFYYDGNNYQHTVHQICNWACPSTTVTSGDSGITYYNIRKINIGEIDGADSIGCSGGTVTVSGASIGVNDYDKYYILSSITYDCHDIITDITTSRINLGDDYKETINLPASSYTIDGIDCDNDSGIREKEFTYEYIYYDENNAESSVTASFRVNQDCECEDCDEYIYSIEHNSALNFDDCGNHLVFNRDYSLDGNPITSITTDGTSVNASVYSASYSCATKDEGRFSYTPKVVWELDEGESKYAILNGDTSITSVTSSAITVSVNAESDGNKQQNISLYVYGYGKDSERIVYSGNCSAQRNSMCTPEICNDCNLDVDFNGLDGSTIHSGDRFTVSGTSLICSFVQTGVSGGANMLIWDPVIVSVSPSGYVEISNAVHDGNTSGFTFDVSLSNTCPSSLNGLELTVSQSGDTDCHKSVTFNVECGSGSEFTVTHLYDTGQCSDINWIGSTGVSGYSSNFIITGTSSDDNGNYVEPVLSYPPGVQNKKWLMNVTHTGTSYTAEIYFEGEYDGILSLPLNLRQYENAGTYFPVNASLCKPVLNCYNWINEVPPQSFPSAVTLYYGVERGVTPTYTGLHCPITIMAKVSGNTDDCRCSDNSGGHFIESGLSMDMSIRGANMTHVFNASELPWECNDHSQGYCYPGKVFTEFSDYGWSFEEGENVKIIDTGSADIFNYKFVKTLNRKKLMNNTDENVTEEK